MTGRCEYEAIYGVHADGRRCCNAADPRVVTMTTSDETPRPDYPLARQAVADLRREMARMTYRTADGEHTTLENAGRMLTTIESLIEHHCAVAIRELELAPPGPWLFKPRS